MLESESQMANIDRTFGRTFRAAGMEDDVSGTATWRSERIRIAIENTRRPEMVPNARLWRGGGRRRHRGASCCATLRVGEVLTSLERRGCSALPELDLIGSM